MGVRNKITDNNMYFLTMTVVNWIDVFTRPIYKHIIVDALQYNIKNKGLIVSGWCLMSNHLHLLSEADEGYHLSDILRDFKKFTSKAIIKEIIDNPQESRKKWLLNEFAFAGKILKKPQAYKFWQEGNAAKEIYSTKFLEQKLDYIHNNPVKAEIVAEPHEYLYSSAKDYAGEKGLLDIVFV
jgi:REP element-mobilizing transposase RayT